MRARTLLLLTLTGAAALAACERTSVTGPEAPGAARFDEGTGGSSGTSAGGYLGSGNRNDSTKTGGGG